MTTIADIEALGIEVPKTKEYEARLQDHPSQWLTGRVNYVLDAADAMRDELLAVIERLNEKVWMLEANSRSYWKLVAEQFPEGITLQRLSFADGKRLTLAGTTTQDQITTLIGLNKNLHATQTDNQPMFLPDDGNALKYQQDKDKVTWNINLLLAHAEDVK